MKTHSIRNKSSNVPILTFSEQLWRRLVATYPEVTCGLLFWFNCEYHKLTGKKVKLNYNQEVEFLDRVGAKKGVWNSKFSTAPLTCYKIISMFTAGLGVSSGETMLGVTTLLEDFYSLMDSNYFNGEIQTQQSGLLTSSVSEN